jgi:hypothetical protein
MFEEVLMLIKKLYVILSMKNQRFVVKSLYEQLMIQCLVGQVIEMQLYDDVEVSKKMSKTKIKYKKTISSITAYSFF